MFKCQITGRTSRPGEKCNKIVLESRERTYHKKVLNEETNRWEEVECSRGWEIVKEINACESGYAEWKSWSPEQRAMFAEALKSR